MKTQKKSARVFRVTSTVSSSGETSFELLTLDGGTPNEEKYYMVKGNSPSSSEMDEINEHLEREDWEELTLEESELTIEDFSI